MLATNLVAPMHLTHALLPRLKAQPQAAIVNIGSTFGSLPFPGFAAYSAAKAGLRGFSQALRRELADIAGRRDPHRAARHRHAAEHRGGQRAEPRSSKQPQRQRRNMVARQVVAALRRGDGEHHFGFPERLFAWLNGVAPSLIDRGLAGKLALDQAAHAHRPESQPERTTAMITALQLDPNACTHVAFALAGSPTLSLPASAATPEDLIRPIQDQWAEIKYRQPEKQQAEQLPHAGRRRRSRVSSRPTRSCPKPLIWEGIVLSSEAGAKGGLGALSLAKEARQRLDEALKLNDKALARLGLHEPGDALCQGARLADRLRRQGAGRGVLQEGAGHQPGRD